MIVIIYFHPPGSASSFNDPLYNLDFRISFFLSLTNLCGVFVSFLLIRTIPRHAILLLKPININIISNITNVYVYYTYTVHASSKLLYTMLFVCALLWSFVLFCVVLLTLVLPCLLFSATLYLSLLYCCLVETTLLDSPPVWS